ncbi:hypothetical protein Q9L58_009671 [Maublancomyces gigas]|uniref:Uncharacterized protein n=1 Tax=Discina gigas TaxID=1032678 RepID=A0ABR3G684_9PEZI
MFTLAVSHEAVSLSIMSRPLPYFICTTTSSKHGAIDCFNASISTTGPASSETLQYTGAMGKEAPSLHEELQVDGTVKTAEYETLVTAEVPMAAIIAVSDILKWLTLGPSL